MSESPAGWYEDDDDPGLARWWDGVRWTEHTMVIPATATGGEADSEEDDLQYFALPGDDAPLPPRSGPSRFPRPGDETTLWEAASARTEAPDAGAFEVGSFGELDDTDNPFFDTADVAVEPGLLRPDWLGPDGPARHRRDTGIDGRDGFADRYRSWPRALRIVVPVIAIALMVGLAVAAATSVGSSGSGTTGDTTDATFRAPTSSSTTAVTFVPLGPPASVVDSTSTTTTAPAATSTTARRTTVTTAAPTTTAAPATTTTAPATTTTAPTTTTTESPTTTAP